MLNFHLIKKPAQSVEAKLDTLMADAAALKEHTENHTSSTLAAIQVLSGELGRLEKVKAALLKLGV